MRPNWATQTQKETKKRVGGEVEEEEKEREREEANLRIKRVCEGGEIATETRRWNDRGEAAEGVTSDSNSGDHSRTPLPNSRNRWRYSGDSPLK